MQKEQNGWVVINIGHPRTGNSFIVSDTFSRTRTLAIKNFVNGSGDSWEYWRKKYNFRVVKSKQTIST